MKYCLLFFILLPAAIFGQTAPFEENDNRTATYLETIRFYEELDRKYKKMILLEAGPTDSPYPLHLAVLSADEDTDPVSIRKKDKRVLFINNGIHPGEPDGVDACMLFFREVLTNPELEKLLEEVVVVAIPIYNIGGAINRNSYSRANQAGPEEYGFRGNSRNLDLNRDFIKTDARESQTFNQAFRQWQPDVFIDTHTSNGADYQYTMTLLTTHPDKLHPALRELVRSKLEPQLYRDMEARGWEMIPYVNYDKTPEEGLVAFMDNPRYSTGYAALFNCIGFMAETHMLKPFRDRVASTRALLEVLFRNVHQHRVSLGVAHRQADAETARQTYFDLQWKTDFSKSDSILFKGYAADYKPSEFTGYNRLYYDRSAPYAKQVPWYPAAKPSITVRAPAAYIIPQAYREVIERLESNGVVLERLPDDRSLEVEQYYIRSYKTVERPYEAHYLHYGVEVDTVSRRWTYRRGDYLVRLDQPANRYIVSALEPRAPDSFFAWNFFDGILMQKEYFSDYVFEDLAARFLEKNPAVREELERKKASDPEFARSPEAQLDWVYRQSPHYEPTHNLYPVGRIME